MYIQTKWQEEKFYTTFMLISIEAAVKIHLQGQGSQTYYVTLTTHLLKDCLKLRLGTCYPICSSRRRITLD